MRKYYSHEHIWTYCCLFFKSYKFNKTTLVVKLFTILFLMSINIAQASPPHTQQDNIVSGVVTDQDGETMPGVSVAIKGTTIGTTTDIDGAYSIKVTDKNAILVFSFLGFHKQEIAVGSRKSINVSLQEIVHEIDEVVVIGYGTTKRANLTGAVSTTDSKAFEARPVHSAANALQGEVAGLTITRSSGVPGSVPEMRIRDRSSINGGSPLVLIDGAEGDINTLNAADIENISVLKDGTAAIYGARASDGVVLITTKNGKKNQKLNVTLDAYYSINKPGLLRKTVNLYQYAQMGLEVTDGSFSPEYTAEDLPLLAENSDKVVPNGVWGAYPKFYKNQDWNKHIIGDGSLQNYNIGLSGGGEKYSYLVSLGFQRETGLPKFGVDVNKKYFVRTKSNIQVLKNLDYEFNLSYEASDREYSTAIERGVNIWEHTYKARSWSPIYNPDGSFYTFQGFNNPAQMLEEMGVSERTSGNITFNNSIRWEVIKGLSVVGRAVISKRDGDETRITKSADQYDWDNNLIRTTNKPNSAERVYHKTLYKNFTLYAEYKKKFNDLHDVGIMIGGANESANYDIMSAKRQNFNQQDSWSLQLGDSENQSAWSEGNAWTINSAFGRINYAFANKYLIEGTLRADGSSRFHPDHRWGYFPGVSGAWRLSEEKFMNKLSVIDDLKLRASYGEMGNQSGIGPYDFIQLISILNSYYPFGDGVKGQMATAGNIVSTARTWETIASTDVGIDFSLLKNRLYGSFDYFWKDNKNMLIGITYPSMLGASAPSTNNGRFEVRGWEISIGWRDRISDFSYSVRASLSDAKNKVVEKGGSDSFSLGWNATRKGYPRGSYFGYAFDGIIQNEEDLANYKARFPNGGVPGNIGIGDAKYKDLDNDGKLTVLGNGEAGQGDAIYLGDTNPRYTFGLNLNAEYKNFDFGAFIQGVGRQTMFLEWEARMPFSEWWYESAEYWYGKTWTKDRTDAKYPAITSDSRRSYNYQTSTNLKHSVAYARLKNIQLGYTIPAKITRKLNLQRIRVYFSGENLFEVHNTPGGWDPEGDGSITSYPFTRNISFGASIVF